MAAVAAVVVLALTPRRAHEVHIIVGTEGGYFRVVKGAERARALCVSVCVGCGRGVP